MKKIRSLNLIIFLFFGLQVLSQVDPGGPTTVDPQFNFSFEYNEISTCNFNADLKIELANGSDSFYDLPFEVDLKDMSDQSESYFDMTSESLIISDLEPGFYKAVIYYTESCYQEFEIDLDFSDSGVHANLSGSDLCNEEEATLLLTDIELYLNEGSTNYSIEWFKDGAALGLTDKTIQVSEGGEYCARIIDLDSNCEDDFCYTVLDYSNIFDATTKSVDCDSGVNDGSIKLEMSQSTDIYDIEISWTGPNDFQSTNQEITDLEIGEYKLTITFTNKNTSTISCIYEELVELYCIGDEPADVGDCPFIVSISNNGFSTIAGSIASSIAINTIVEINIYDQIGNVTNTHLETVTLDPSSMIDPTTIQYFGLQGPIIPGTYHLELSYFGEVCYTTPITIFDTPTLPCPNYIACPINSSTAIIFCIPECTPVAAEIYSEGFYTVITDDCPCNISNIQSDDCDEYYINDDEEIQTRSLDIRVIKFSSEENKINIYIYNETEENFQLEISIPNPNVIQPIKVHTLNDNYLLIYKTNSKFEIIIVDKSGNVIDTTILEHYILSVIKEFNSIYITHSDSNGDIYTSSLSSKLELSETLKWNKSLKSDNYLFSIDKDYSLHHTIGLNSTEYTVVNIRNESFNFSLTNNVEIISGHNNIEYFSMLVKANKDFTIDGNSYGDNGTTYYLLNCDRGGNFISVSQISTDVISEVYDVNFNFNIVIGNGETENCLDVQPIGASDANINNLSRESSQDIEKVSIRPNPFSNYFEVDILEYFTKPINAKIVNSLGQVLNEISLESKRTLINTESFGTGVYFIELEINGQKQISKIVKY